MAYRRGVVLVEQLSIQIRTANRDRKANLGVPPDIRVAEILDACKTNWQLPSNYEYIVRHERLGRELRLNDTLREAGIESGDTLEVQQISDAGEGSAA
jgi:hypothetical protein